MHTSSRALHKFTFAALICLCATGLFAGVQLPATTPSASSSTRDSSSDLLQARQFLANGRFDEARVAVRRALSLSPKNIAALNLLGVIYDHEREYDEANDVLRQALSLDPRSSDTLNNLGASYAAQGKSELAEQMFRGTLKFHPTNRTANYNLALLLLDRKQPKEALAYLAHVFPQDSASQLATIRADFEAGMVPDGLRAADTLSRGAASDLKVHFSLGMLLGSHRQYAQAVHELEIANALAPGTPEVLLNLGQAYLLAGNSSQAEKVLSGALKLQPDSSRALYLLAQSLSDQQKDVDALELLVRARKIAPDDTNILFMMGRLSMKQSFFEDAIELLKQAVEIDPRRADLHAALGESYFTVGKVDRALEEFKILVALDPSPRSFSFMGLCYRHLNQYDDAKLYFNKALAADSNNLPALFNLGLIARKQLDDIRATKYLTRAVQIDPNYSDALFELGTLKLDQKNYAEAIPLLKRCTETSLRPAQAYYKLALAERNAHELAAAQRDMNVFQTLSKNPQPGPYPLQHFFDYLEQRNSLSEERKDESDLRQIQAEVQQHPDRPRSFYLLASAYLKLDRPKDALQAIDRLDELSNGDFRTNVNVGVLLGRYHLAAEAIHHLEAALKTNPDSDEAKYDLSEAYFQSQKYNEALQVLLTVSASGQLDSAYQSLVGDTYGHLDRTQEAAKYFLQAIAVSPNSDQNYASMALLSLREGNVEQAATVVQKGLSHIPDSARLYWITGLIEVRQGALRNAEQSFKRAQLLDPSNELPFISVGMLYYEQGRISEARDVLNQCREMFPNGAIDLEKINQVLNAASEKSEPPRSSKTLLPEAAREFYELNLAMAESNQ